MATSKRVGNYAISAEAVARNSDAIFDAAMSNKPDFTKISKEAMKGRSLERRAVTEAEGNVAKAGIEAFDYANRTKIKEDTKKEVANILRPAKRMAGIVGGLGAIAGGYVMMEGNKKDKADREELRGLRAQMDAKSETRFQEQEARSKAQIEKIKATMGLSGSGDSAVTGTGTVDQVSTAKPSNSSTAVPSFKPSDSPTNISTGPKPKTTPSSGFQGFVSMAQSAGAKYPQLVAAQWALESGWGKTPSGKNNFFGIKAGAGEQGTSKNTWEVYGGKEVNTSARFKDFESPQGSVNELVSRWHKDYKNYSGVNNAPDAFSAADMLTTEGYATDPKYAEKLKKIMRDQGY